MKSFPLFMDASNCHWQNPTAYIRMLGLLLVTAFLHGCASSDAPNPRKALMANFSLPSPGKAKVVFILPKTGMDLNIHDGERLVAKLGEKTYGVYECDPGQRIFSASFGNMEILDATLLPDRIYYVKAAFEVRTWTAAWVRLTPLHPGMAGKDWQNLPRILSGLKLREVTPEQEAHDRTGIKRYMERFQAYRNKPEGVFPRIMPEYGQSTPVYPQ